MVIGTIKEYKERAIQIKKWRVEEGCSYRKVHINFQKKYIPEEKWYKNEKNPLPLPHGNQNIGIKLCINAMVILNEEKW